MMMTTYNVWNTFSSSLFPAHVHVVHIFMKQTKKYTYIGITSLSSTYFMNESNSGKLIKNSIKIIKYNKILDTSEYVPHDAIAGRSEADPEHTSCTLPPPFLLNGSRQEISSSCYKTLLRLLIFSLTTQILLPGQFTIVFNIVEKD